MGKTGIIRRLDSLGRLVIPKELRSSLGIREGGEVEIFAEDERIILRKFDPSCTFCGSTEELMYFRGKLVCRKCLEQLKVS